MGHERNERAEIVDRTQRRGVMRYTATGIGRTVERIDDDDDVAIEIRFTGLFRQNSDMCTFQHVECRTVGHQIGSILAVSHA